MVLGAAGADEAKPLRAVGGREELRTGGDVLEAGDGGVLQRGAVDDLEGHAVARKARRELSIGRGSEKPRETVDAAGVAEQARVGGVRRGEVL